MLNNTFAYSVVLRSSAGRRKDQNDSGCHNGAKLQEFSGRMLSFKEDRPLAPEDSVRQLPATRCDCGVKGKRYALQTVFDVPLRTMVKRDEGATTLKGRIWGSSTAKICLA
jgi:hypothetical protein